MPRQTEAELLERLSRMRHEIDRWEHKHFEQEAIIQKLTASSNQIYQEIEEIREVLEWYADPQTYKPLVVHGIRYPKPIDDDFGDWARKMLAKLPATKEQL